MKTSTNNTELEVKFALVGLTGIEESLIANGGKLVSKRIHEVNLRFDTPALALTQSRQVLRLRRDVRTYLTYKGPGAIVNGVQQRTEIEIEVDDFERANLFLSALGYRVSMIYEKYRTMYRFQGVTICLDEMPFGCFVELEGEGAQSIRECAEALSLSWEAAILDSYSAIFERLRSRLGFEFRDLTFENFSDIPHPLADSAIPIIDR